jgi:hypothetical protein
MQTMNRLLSGGLMLACAATLAGCASLAGGDIIRAGDTSTSIIEVINSTANPIHAVLISECDNFTYGFNRMADGEVIPVGGSRQFEVSSGCWDVSVGTLGVGEVRRRFNMPANSIQPYEVTGG